MAREYRGGKSLAELAKEYGLTKQGVSYRLRTHGVVVRSRGNAKRRRTN